MENIEALKEYNSSLLSLVETYQEMCAGLNKQIADLESKWLGEQAVNLAIEAEYELQSQQLANAEAMAEVDADMNQSLRERLKTQEGLIEMCEKALIYHREMTRPIWNTANTLIAISSYKLLHNTN